MAIARNKSHQMRRPVVYVASGLLLLSAGATVIWSRMAPSPPQPTAHPAYTSGGYKDDQWFLNSQGYQNALQVSDQNKAPMLIYAYTDWCINCRKFATELLTDVIVKRALEGFVKVKLNPEDGPQEEALSEELGVRGYPNLFVQSGSARPAAIIKAPFIPTDSGWQLMKPEQFLNVLSDHGLIQRGGQ